MRGVMVAIGSCLVVVAFACGSTIDDTSGPRSPGKGTDAAADAATPLPMGDADATTGEGSGGPVSLHALCFVSRECASGKCFPDPDGATDAGVPVGQCVDDDSCVIAEGKAKVDSQCNDVLTCLGYHCVPVGIVAAPSGVFACGIPGDACKNEEGSRCCYTDCGDDGKCRAPDD